jgi:hypothetical protein
MDAGESLIDRIRRQLAGEGDLTEDRVFDGVGFFVEGRMAVAVLGDELCLHLEGSPPSPLTGSGEPTPFLFAGRPVPGWVSIPAHDLGDEALGAWLGRGLAAVNSTM